MVKSLKLINKNISFNGIDFSGFSSSNGWVGYFERKSGFSLELVEDAVRLFEIYFNNDNDQVMIVSALCFDDKSESDNIIIEHYKRQVEEAKALKIFTAMTPSFERYLYGEAPLPANSLSFHFCQSSFTLLSKLIMAHGGVIGDVCFYINITKNIAVYPHGDTGFGCIGMNNEKYAAVDFLNYCKKNVNFNVVIDI